MQKVIGKKLLLAVVLVAIIIVAIVIFFVKHNNDVHSREQAKAAASSYVSAAHKYLRQVSPKLAEISSSKTSNEDSAKLAKQIQSLMDQQPKLKTVGGAGAKLAIYQQAKSYSSKVSKFNDSLTTLTAVALSQYIPLSNAYVSLLSTQTKLSKDLSSSNNPATILTKDSIEPLSAQKAKLSKINFNNDYKPTLKVVKTGLDYQINAAKQLHDMYSSGNLHSVNFNLSATQKNAYNALKVKSDQLNHSYGQLAKQANELAVESR